MESDGLKIETEELSPYGGWRRRTLDEGRSYRTFERGPSFDPVRIRSGVNKEERVLKNRK